MQTGPIPKRTTERLGHGSAESLVVSKGKLELDEPLGPEPPAWLGPFGTWFYEMFRYSGQAKYYAPSDWAMLLLLCDMVRHLHRKPAAVMYSSIMQAASLLGATESDRRRMKIELDAIGVDDDAADEAERDAEQEREWAAGLSPVPDLPKEPAPEPEFMPVTVNERIAHGNAQRAAAAAG